MGDILRFITGPLPGPALGAVYEPALVVLSYLVAAFAAYCAIDLADRVREFREEKAKANAWLIGGAITMGAGIWSMHFVGMLAYKLPIPVRFEVFTTLFSMLVAVVISGFALRVVTRDKLSWKRLLTGGTVMGAGIGTMHYTGMAALRLDAIVMYWPGTFALSVVNAVVCSTVALWLVFKLKGSSIVNKVLSALVMGVAIAGMHYTGMFATVCVGIPGSGTMVAGLDPQLLAVSIAVITLLIIAIGLTVSMQSQLLSQGLKQQNERLVAEIKHRSEVEAELQHHRDNLQALVEERTAELTLARDAAESGNRAKSQFLAMMSHEIRTPMNGVMGMIELLLGSKLDAKQKRFAEVAHHSGVALLTVINDILDFSRIEAGKLELVIESFDLRNLSDEVVDALAESARRKQLELGCVVAGELPRRFRGDHGRLRQVLVNLLSNAIKYTDRGRAIVRITGEGENDAGMRLKFEVIDTGKGIGREHVDRVFDMFTRLQNDRTSGTGLGLAICKQLVDKMGGEIGIESEPGKGSTFWFRVTLPRADDVEAAASVQSHPPLHQLRVLVVDDNPVNREILTHQLLAMGVRHEGASDAAEALALLRDAATGGQPYDVAILDAQMPGMDGIELARGIRAEEGLAGTRLLMESSCDDNEAAARDAGVDCYLVKPVRQSSLYDYLMGVAGISGVMRPGNMSAGVTPLRANILLAEDHPVNRELALAMLEELGCRAEIAHTGHEAFDAFRRGGLDLILMDCQMPELDGFEATAKIRLDEAERNDGRRIPIVALTASAVAGDREKCLAAGMDDYVSKPFSLIQLESVLKRWLPPVDTMIVPAVRAMPPRPTSPRLDWEVLARMRKLGNGDELVTRIIGVYLGDAPRRQQMLREAVARGDLQAAGRAAHAFKSASANLGASLLSDLCGVMEELCRENLRNNAAALMADIDIEYSVVATELSKHAYRVKS